MAKLRVFTSFSGYDSQCMALDRLGIYYELTGWSEIDRYAIQAHNAVYPQWSDRNYGDICNIDWKDVPDFDLFTYSSPCQDFSAAGLQRGGQKGSGTRSSLLWECERAIEAKRPKYLLMENVAALVSSKFIKLFNKWQHTLDGYGYTNYAKVLNAKEYGVPQNRERIFMVSVRDDLNQKFYFPQPFKLEKRLKDILEDRVDEKYYISDTRLTGLINSTKKQKLKGNGFKFEPKTDKDIATTIQSSGCNRKTDNFIKEPTIAAMRGRNPENTSDRSKGTHCEQRLEVGKNISNALTSVQKDNLLVEPKVEQIGNIVDDSNRNFKNQQRGRIYGTEGLSPAICTFQGGNLEPKIVQRQRGYNKGGERDLCPTIGCNSFQENNKLIIPQATKDGYIEVEQGGVFDGSYPNSKTRRGRVQENGNVTPALMASGEPLNRYEGDFRIRKLTPTECFRLMDVSENDIVKLLNSGISNSQLYKLAGNSIVVSCLYHIFRKLFVDKENESNQLTLF